MLTADPIRLITVDDHEIVRDGVALLAGRDRGIAIVGSASTIDDAVELVREHRPDVVLLDLRLPGVLATEGIDAIRSVATETPPKIIVFTAYSSHASLVEVLAAGVEGCIVKDAGGVDLMATIRAVHRGARVIDPRLAGSATTLDLPNGATLTRREYQLIRRVAMGETNPEISDALDLSRNTVKTYLQSAFRKLGARNRIDAVNIATELGLL